MWSCTTSILNSEWNSREIPTSWIRRIVLSKKCKLNGNKFGCIYKTVHKNMICRSKKVNNRVWGGGCGGLFSINIINDPTEFSKYQNKYKHVAKKWHYINNGIIPNPNGITDRGATIIFGRKIPTWIMNITILLMSKKIMGIRYSLGVCYALEHASRMDKSERAWSHKISSGIDWTGLGIW